MSTVDSKSSATDTDIQNLALALAESADEMKAVAIRILDVRGIVSYADYVIVCNGTSVTHVAAISAFIREDLRPLKIRPRHVEGGGTNEWVLLDFFDVIVHVFEENARREYAIEALFSDAPRLAFEGSEEPEEIVNFDDFYEDDEDDADA